jgi:hypothetical protein
VILVRRIPGTKTPIGLAAVVAEVNASLAEDQDALYSEALERRERSTLDVDTIADTAEAAKPAGPGSRGPRWASTVRQSWPRMPST